jgi:hypothetical protein
MVIILLEIEIFKYECIDISINIDSEFNSDFKWPVNYLILMKLIEILFN